MGTALEYMASAYFVLNVWEEHLDGGHVEWRGEMLHVDSNTTLRFEDWPELVELIAAMRSISSAQTIKSKAQKTWPLPLEDRPFTAFQLRREQ
jgi:hypothetical protein